MKKIRRDMGFNWKLNVVFFTIISVALIAAFLASYFTTTGRFESVTENNAISINQQVTLNFEAYFEEHRVLMGLLSESIETESSSAADIQNILTSYQFSNPNVESITLFTPDGSIVKNDTPSRLYRNRSDVSFIGQSLDNPLLYIVTPQPDNSLYYGTTSDTILMSKAMYYYDGDVRQLGVLAFEIDLAALESILDSVYTIDGGHSLLIGPNETVILTTLSNCSATDCGSLDLVLDMVIGSGFETLDDSRYYVSIQTIAQTRFRLATFMNVDVLQTTNETLFLIIFLIFVSTLVVGLFVFNIVSKAMTKPLIRLQNHMKELNHRDHLYQEVAITGQKEIVELGNEYNRMIREIRTLLKNLEYEENEKRKTELIALQTQINPHFLYNTLDSIVGLSEQNKHEDVINMVISLSRFFRISISKGQPIIAIQKELEHAQNYLNIQKIRYGYQFDYRFDVNPEVHQYSTIKLILQPLIENAITHGIEQDEPGEITIKADLDDEFIHFYVTNTGYGLTDEQIATIYRNIHDDAYTSVGLKNVYQRLKLYYQTRIIFEFYSDIDVSTTVHIAIPKHPMRFDDEA